MMTSAIWRHSPIFILLIIVVVYDDDDDDVIDVSIKSNRRVVCILRASRVS